MNYNLVQVKRFYDELQYEEHEKKEFGNEFGPEFVSVKEFVATEEEARHLGFISRVRRSMINRQWSMVNSQ
jgi:hypothetical protein